MRHAFELDHQTLEHPALLGRERQGVEPALSRLAEEVPLVGWDQVSMQDRLHASLDPDDLRQDAGALGALASAVVGVLIGNPDLRKEAGSVQPRQRRGIHLVGLHASVGDGANEPWVALCRLHGATLVIAKLDRLSRDAAFLLNLQKAGVRFVAADMPEANELAVGIMAVVAQAERKMISTRTKAALAAAKARGVRLGRPENLTNHAVGQARGRERQAQRARERAQDLAPILAEARATGAVSLRQIAAALNDRAVPAARGGVWTATQVRRALLIDRS